MGILHSLQSLFAIYTLTLPFYQNFPLPALFALEETMHTAVKRKVERQLKVLIKNFGHFLSMAQQAAYADIIPNSADGIFSPKTEGTRH
jgi:hypothetical protein